MSCIQCYTFTWINSIKQNGWEKKGRKVTDEENNALKCISKIRARIEYMTNEESALRKYGIRANSICLYVTMVSSKLKNVGKRYKTWTGNLVVACEFRKLNFQESILIRYILSRNTLPSNPKNTSTINWINKTFLTLWLNKIFYLL